MKGPFTQQRDELAAIWRWKAETIVRWFGERGLGLTEAQKIEFLANEFAALQMHFEARAK